MSFNLSTFIFEIINFLVLAYILQRLLYRPLHDMIDRRRQAIACAQNEAKEATRQANELQRQFRARMAESEEERRQIIDMAHQEAERQRQSILEAADAEAHQRLKEAANAIAVEQKDAREALRDDVTRDALRLTERLLQEASGSSLQRHMVQRLVAALDATSPEERKQLERGVSLGGHAVLQSASRPDPEDIEAVGTAVGRLLGNSVPLDVRTKANLLGGVRLQPDGHVWDASLAQVLEGTVRDDP